MNTRDMIGEFQRAFKRPVNDTLVKNLSVTDRLLLGKILFEETLETIEKGLGLRLAVSNDHEYTNDFIDNGIQYSVADCSSGDSNFALTHIEGDRYDPIETADGIGDVNVVIHFIAHWLGMNLDRITAIINDSNMSKLDENGEPIINGEGIAAEGQPWHKPELPVGKILKSKNFYKPDIASAIGLCDRVGCPLEGQPHRHSAEMESAMQSMTRDAPGVHIDESIIKPSAALDHCSEHPDQTTANCEGGYGLAGGGVGTYSICGTCGKIFGKTDDGDDFG